MTGVVHVICASLRPDADETAVAHALELAHGLREADRAEHVVVGRSAGALTAVSWLRDRDSLEPFAASPAHMSFIMRGLAPCIAGMWSAAVESDATPDPAPKALWVFALRDAGTLYEWQVRDLLRSVEALPGTAAVGPTIEERERYRAGGVVNLHQDEIDAFREALPRSLTGIAEIAALLVHEFVPVHSPGAAQQA